MDFARWVQHLPWIVEINGSADQISVVWLFHFVGYFLAVGSSALVNLRLLGLARKGQSADHLARQLFPWVWLGVVFVIASGFIMFAGFATAFWPAPVFRIKVTVFLLAILAGVIIDRNVSKWDRLPSLPAQAKVMAAISLLLWFGLILASVEVPAFIDGI